MNESMDLRLSKDSSEIKQLLCAPAHFMASQRTQIGTKILMLKAIQNQARVLSCVTYIASFD
jgi:hypothetical protein